MGRTLYWVGNAGRADDPAHYALSSGGAGGEALPTPDDDLIIDAQSFTLPGQYILFPLMVDVLLSTPVFLLSVGNAVTIDLVAPAPIDTALALSVDEAFPDPLDLFPPGPAPGFGLALPCLIACPATPAVVILAGHGLSDNDVVRFTVDTGVIANEIAVDTTYYAKVIDIDSFYLMVVPDGEIMDITGTQTATTISLWREG